MFRLGSVSEDPRGAGPNRIFSPNLGMDSALHIHQVCHLTRQHSIGHCNARVLQVFEFTNMTIFSLCGSGGWHPKKNKKMLCTSKG